MKNAFRLLIVFLVQINSYVIAQNPNNPTPRPRNSMIKMPDFVKSTQMKPKDLDRLDSLGEAYLKAEDYEKAEQVYEDLIEMRTPPLSDDYFSLGNAYYSGKKFSEADSIFSILIGIEPNLIRGYLWRARVKSWLDPDSEKGLARQDYESVVTLALKYPEKFEEELVEAYEYLGYYYFVINQLSNAESYWRKVLDVQPDNQKAREAVKALESLKIRR